MDSKKHYLGHRQRLRERLEHSPRSLADYEVLELLLGYVLARRDTKPLAKELLDRFGTLKGVFAARGEELRSVPGFGPALEAFWGLWRETWARMGESALRERRTLTGPADVAEMAMARLGGEAKEEFWVAMVDSKNRLMHFEPVSRGTVDRTAVYVREVMALALDHEASGIMLVHNHPAGGLDPSREDVELTRRIAEAARTMGVRLLDHLIVTADGFFSFQSEGMLTY